MKNKTHAKMNILQTKSDAVTTLRWTREVAALGGAVTGITVMWGMVYFNVAEATGSQFVGGIAAVVGTLVGLFIIDFSYRRNFPYVADLIVSGQAFRNWRILIFTLLLLLLSAAQMVSSAFLSWEGRKDVAEGIIKAPELQDVASVKVAADKTTSAKIREVKSQITALDWDIREREKAVEKSYPAFVEKIRAGSDKWGWYAKQLDKKKAESVGTLRQERANLSEALSELVGSQAASDKLLLETVAGENRAKLSQYSEKKARNMRFLGFFGVGCLGVVAFVSIMLSLIGYSDLEEMDMKETKRPFREMPAAPARIQPAPAPGPETVVPVRSSSQFDAYEIARRQQMAEARIEAMKAEQAEQLRQIEARQAEAARQAAEQIQAERDRADRLQAEQLRQPESRQALSDNEPVGLSEKLSVSVSDKGISVEGKTYGVAELSNLKDKSQKWYNRQFSSKTEKGRADNKARWDSIKPAWEQIGANLVYSGQSVSIEGGQLSAVRK